MLPAEASQPEDWDEDEDGEWEPPKVSNPKCAEGPGCGDWKRPMKPNPDYKGKWTAPMIDNPEYKARPEPLSCRKSALTLCDEGRWSAACAGCTH